MKVTIQSDKYRPELVRKRYVRVDYQGGYKWCEVGDDRRYDLRQGTAEPHEVPIEIREAAYERRNVEWPL